MTNPTIENERLILETRPEAGQMASLWDKKNEREMLYQGDQGWKDQNPTLFPMVGKTWNDGKYEIDGEEYQMKNHGLIRYENLNGEVKDGRIVYSFDSDEKTKKEYPFDFHFEMSYRLDGNRVIVDYEIKNLSNRPMPFSFGLHPAFRTSQNEEEKFEDFSIVYDEPLECTQIVTHEDMSSPDREKVSLEKWNLSREDLKKYATLVYEHPNATNATIYYKDEPRLNVHFENYPYLAIWSHPTPSDFICIEPWHGHSDFEKAEVPFENREGTEILQPEETFRQSYSIEVL